MAFEEGGFAIYQVNPLFKMYNSPSWFTQQANSLFVPEVTSPTKTGATPADNISYRVVLIQMQFTSNIIALVLKSVVPRYD